MNPKTICVSCMEDDSGLPVCPKCQAPFIITSTNSLLLLPRTVLRDQYLIGRALGHGGFGITYLAWDIGLQARFAVKEYMPSGVAYRNGSSAVSPVSDKNKDEFDWGLDRFMEEARLLKKRNHSNIVSLDTVFRDNGTAYLVMEYLEGVTFEEFLRRRGGTVPLPDALRIMVPAMDALSAVHRDNILHRDVSPDNIFITKTGKVKLIDFGAARHALRQKSAKLTVIQKPGFSPEEQYRQNGSQGSWTDVYSTAATLYRAVTGEIPSGSLDRQAEDSLQNPLQLGIAMPADAANALMKALAVRAPDRFQTMDEFKQALTGRVPLSQTEPISLPASAAPAVQARAAAAGQEVRSQPLVIPPRMPADDSSTLETKIRRYETSAPKTEKPPVDAPRPVTSLPTQERRPLPKWVLPLSLGVVGFAICAFLAWHFWPAGKTNTSGLRSAWPSQSNSIPQSDTERQRALDEQPQDSTPETSATPPPAAPDQTASLPAEPSPAPAPPIARSQSAAPPAKAAPNPAPVNPPPAPSPVAPTLSYDAMIKKASSMATAQQYDQAQSLLNSAIQSDPSNWKAYSELGKIELYNLNQPDAAFGHFRKALDYGGEVTFRVALEHGLSGSLTLSKTHGSIIDGADVHNFALTDVQEAKRSKLGLLKVGKGRHSFSIHLTSGDNYNLEPTSKSAEQEVSFILSILRS